METPKTSALRRGFLSENPVFFRAAFLCPAIAAAKSVTDALIMGIAVLFVTSSVGLFCSPLKRILKYETAFYFSTAVVSAAFTTLADIALFAVVPDFAVSMKHIIPLIAVGCIVLSHGDFAGGGSAKDWFFRGAGAAFTMLIAAALRELSASGTVAGVPVFGAQYPGLAFFDTIGGVLIVMGLVAGGIQFASGARKKTTRKSGPKE